MGVPTTVSSIVDAFTSSEIASIASASFSCMSFSCLSISNTSQFG